MTCVCLNAHYGLCRVQCRFSCFPLVCMTCSGLLLWRNVFDKCFVLVHRENPLFFCCSVHLRHMPFSMLWLILLIFDTQGPGWYVLSKTRLTTQGTAGIPIWSPLDSCSACAASAQRCLLAFINFITSQTSKGVLR